MYRRADALEPGDRIIDGANHLKVIDTRREGDRIHLVTELRGWGEDGRAEWSCDYRHRFELEVVVMADTITVNVSWTFDGFFSGSSVGQGMAHEYSRDPELVAAAESLYEKYSSTPFVKCGFGRSQRLELEPLEADILHDYATACEAANSDLEDQWARSEAAAGRRLAEIIEREARKAGWEGWS